MQSEQLHAQILGVQPAWRVPHTDLHMSKEQVDVHAELDPSEPAVRLGCGASCPRHDTEKRSWRHHDPQAGI